MSKGLSGGQMIANPQGVGNHHVVDSEVELGMVVGLDPHLHAAVVRLGLVQNPVHRREDPDLRGNQSIARHEVVFHAPARFEVVGVVVAGR